MYKAIQKFKNQQAQLNKARRLKAKRLRIAERIFWGISAISAIYVLSTLSHVFVSSWYVAFVWALSGIVVSAFLIQNMKMFWMGVFFSGSIFVAVPLFINDVFADPEIQNFNVIIKHKYHRSSRTSPRVEVEFAEVGTTIYADDNLQVDISSYVMLKLRRGYWGYYIKTGSEFVKE